MKTTCGCLVAILSLASAARADTFLLSAGGRIDGELLNATESPRTKYVVRSSGATVTFDKNAVREVLQANPAEAEYQKLRHEQPDTVAGHLALADWCRDHKLNDQRKRHLERVLELDPNNAGARSQLGYAKLGGQWRTRQEHMAALGKVQHKGEWLYPQEIEILEKRDEAARLKAEWIGNLKRWRDWLGGEKDQAARSGLQAIADPAAVPAIVLALDDEPRFEVRVLLIRALARIGTLDAQLLLAKGSLGDPSAEVRATALDLLVESPQPAIVNYYIQQLRSKDNEVINGAAYALARFKDTRAVGPLIDALVTSHKFQIVSGSPGGGLSASNGPNGSGLSTGSSVQIVQQLKNNQQVLNTLILLTNNEVNYQYNVDAWKQWFAGRKKNTFVDSRRG
jgi:hypothetical protein